MGYLVLRKDQRTRIHLSEISILLIESTAVSLTAALLNELVRRKIRVIFCDEKRNPSSELSPYYGSHHTSLRIRQQINWTESIKKDVWTQIVRDKIMKQAEHLEMYSLSEAKLLRGYIDELELADATNREGHAAKVYFNSLFGNDFARNAETSTNAALNYGYSILLSAFNRSIVANGYITQIGLFHDNQYNQFNLTADLMEPFRPLVDMKVKELCPKRFEREEKLAVLEFLQQDVRIAGRQETVSNAIEVYCKSVLDALTKERPECIRFYQYEL